MRFFIRGGGGLERHEALTELTAYEYYAERAISDDRKRKAELFGDELDFAFFAARLGWSIDDYEATNPVQRKFIRKEIESYTVEASSLLESAIEVAVSNCLRKRGKQRAKLWKKKPGTGEMVVSQGEAKALKRAMAEKAPWTPWQEGGGRNG